MAGLGWSGRAIISLDCPIYPSSSSSLSLSLWLALGIYRFLFFIVEDSHSVIPESAFTYLHQVPDPPHRINTTCIGYPTPPTTYTYFAVCNPIHVPPLLPIETKRKISERKYKNDRPNSRNTDPGPAKGDPQEALDQAGRARPAGVADPAAQGIPCRGGPRGARRDAVRREGVCGL